MKLYESSATPNCRRVRIFLAEKGLTVPSVPVDLGKLEHMTGEFERINPIRQVPALELNDGTIITESVAICRYFEETHPEPSLFGATTRERVAIEMWQRRIELGLFMAVMHVFRHGHPAMAQMENPQIPEWAEVNKARIAEALVIIDRELEKTRFICGDTYSIADITAQVAIRFMKAARVQVPENLVNITRWFEDVSSRPSAKA